MKCPHCNNEHPEGTKFCPETGKNLFFKKSEYDFSNSFANYLDELYKKTEGLSGEELHDALFGTARNEEERKGMEETFEDNKLFHQKKGELEKSGLPPVKWFEKEVEGMATDLLADPNTGKVSESDMDQIKQAVRTVLEDELKDISDEVSKQMDELNCDIENQKDSKCDISESNTTKEL